MSSTTWGAMTQDYKENSELAVLPNARYQLEVISAAGRETDISPTYKVAAGPYAGKRVMIGVLSVKGNAVGPFFKAMKNGFGLDETYFAQFANTGQKETLAAVAKAIVGTITEVDLVQEGPNEFHDDTRMKTPKPSQTKWVLIRKGAGAGVEGVPAPAAVAAPVAPAPVAVAAVAEAPAALPAPVAPAVVAEVPAAVAVAAPAVVAAPAAVEAPAPAPAAVPAAPAVAAPAVVAAPAIAPVAVAAPALAEAPAPAAVAAPVAPAAVASAVVVTDEPNF